MAENLSKKLQTNQDKTSGNSTKDLLYTVVDTISKSYAPQHQEGITKAKVQLASAIAKRFDLQKSDVDKLKIAMLLYDIGNIMVPMIC